VSRYNPDKHHRRSIRLRGYDYTQAGAYFVTIVTHGREPVFGDVADGEMELSAYGRVAATMWQRIPRHFPRVQLDEWVVMPNHVHGIIVIVGRGDAFSVRPSDDLSFAHGELAIAFKAPDGECVAPTGPPSGSLGAIVGNFKSVMTRRVNHMRKTPGIPLWQRNYYERIIRNERELNRIRQYICDNPARWFDDAENPVVPYPGA
jgi:REP element-mobilizing transposase RayT